jgi:hypothetical protein
MFVWTCTGGGTHQPIGYNGAGDKCPVCEALKEADRRVAVVQEENDRLAGAIEQYRTELGI